MTTREIVTLQLGHYANFVGTHMWNLQSSSYSNRDNSADAKEINFDVTFREGRTLSGEITYTPRVIIFDLKGSLNTLKQSGVLYDLPTSTQDLQWPASVTTHEFSGAQKNNFLLHLDKEELNSLGESQAQDQQGKSDDMEDTKTDGTNFEKGVINANFDLDKVVKVWSDYLKIHLHHKTVCVLPQHNHYDSDKFNMLSLGKESCKDQMSEIEDRLHFFTEECDNFQGFHLLVDAYNGFSGFAGHLYEDYIGDEFNNKSCFVINTFPQSCSADAKTCTTSLINMFFGIDAFSSCSGILPMSTTTSLLYGAKRSDKNVKFPLLDYNPTLHYQTSAILASALDNLSLPYRLTDHVSHLGHYISSLTNSGRKVLALQTSLPFELEYGRSMFDSLKSSHEQSNKEMILPQFFSLTPGVLGGGKVSCQNATVSGITNEMLFGSEAHAAKPRYSGVEDMLQDYLSQTFKTCMNNVQVVKRASRICEPYPHIFSQKIGQGSKISPCIKRPRVESSGYPSSVPVATLLQNNSGVAGHLREILEGTEKVRKDRMERYLDGVMEMDDFREKLDDFKSLINAYDDIQQDMI